MHPLLLCLPLCPPDPSAGFAVFATNPDGTGSVRVCSTDSPAYGEPAELRNVQLLECVPAGSTPLDETWPGHARLRCDVPQGSRVLLPNGQGSIYHFRRVDADATRFGFLRVDAGGGARSLFELPAGPEGSDPFLNSVASAPDGSHVLVATEPAAGGCVWELACDGSAARARTPGPALHVFGRDSFFLGANFAVALATDGVWRWDPRTDQAAVLAPFACGSVPAWCGLELVPSRNGEFATFLGGDSQVQCVPWVVGLGGDVQPMSDTPRSLSGAGFLPEHGDGPWLALSDDGLVCAFREADAHVYARELFLARRVPGGTNEELQVTQDALFHPYIDEIGLAIFRPDGRLVFWAGDQGAGPALLTRADLFQASLDPGGTLQLQNLTLTSGEATPPFVNYPALRPEQVWLNASGSSLLAFSRDSLGDHVLYARTDVPGLSEIENDVSAVGALEFMGDEVLLSASRPSHPGDNGVSRVELGSNPESDLFLQLSTSAQHDRGVRGPAHAYAFVTQEVGSEKLWQVDLENESSRLFTNRPLVYGPSLAYAADGALVFSVGAPGAPAVFLVWPATGPAHRVWSQALTGFVLPGA